MKRFLKRIIVSVSIGSMCVSSIPVLATESKQQQYAINDIGALKRELNSNAFAELSKVEKQKISKDINPNVKAEFFTEKIETALIEFSDMEVDLSTTAEGNQYGEETIDLGDGCYAILEVTDKEDLNLSQTIAKNVKSWINPTVYAKSSKVTKKYGNRYFTASFNVVCGIGGAKIVLENHYKLSSSGITERYGVSSCSSVSLGGTISHGDPVITDKTATTPGKSDTNMHCQYEVNGSAGGVWNYSKTFTLNTRLIYNSINKSAKTITLTHEWTKK